MRCTPATRQSNRNSLSEIAHLAKSLYTRSVQNENTFYFDPDAAPVPVAVWGTGNMGRAAIRAVDAHPGLTLVAVLTSTADKAGRDAGELAGLGRDLGMPLSTDVDAGLAALGGAGAVAYTASGDIRPDAALADVRRALAAGAVVVTPAVYALYDPRNAPEELREPLLAAARAGGAALFVSGVDPGWGNDVLPVLVSGLAGDDRRRSAARRSSTTRPTTQPDAVRYLVGMGEPMDYEPPMVAPAVPTMVWGGQVRMIARALGVELDEIRETAGAAPARGGRRPTRMGTVRGGAPRARCGSRCRASSTASRASWSSTSPGSHPACAPDWPVAARRRRRRAQGRSSRGGPGSRSASRRPTRAATAPPAATPPPPAGSSTRSRGCAPPSPGSTTASTYRSPPPRGRLAPGRTPA